MELRAGYKQTEVGVIPEDWEVKDLGCIGTLKKGRTIARKDLSEIGFPCVLYGEIYTKYDFVASKLTSRIPQHIAETATRLEKGDILFAGSGETAEDIGKCFAYVGDEQAYAGGDLIILTPHTVNSVLLGYLLNAPIITRQKAQLAQGSSVFHIYANSLKNIRVPLPSTEEEQRAIAAALSDVDALIASLDALIAKKRAIKQGAMQELLTGKKRLAGFGGEWKSKTFGSLGRAYGGLSGKTRADFENGNRPYITFLNVMNNPVIDVHAFEYVNIRHGEVQNKARRGDLFFNTSSETPEEVGMCSFLSEDVGDLYLNSFCFGFRLNTDVEADGLFLSYLLRSDVGRRLMFPLAQGATRHNLSKSAFYEIELLLPSLIEQRAIAEIVTDMDTEIAALEQKRAKYQLVKQGMMQELLTGKTRLI
jgi:type I restriction enzyme S subunit